MIAVLCLCSNNLTLLRSMVILTGNVTWVNLLQIMFCTFPFSRFKAISQLPEHCRIYCYGIILIFLEEIIFFHHIPLFFIIQSWTLINYFQLSWLHSHHWPCLGEKFGLSHLNGHGVRTPINCTCGACLVDIYFCHTQSFTCWNSFWYTSSNKIKPHPDRFFFAACFPSSQRACFLDQLYLVYLSVVIKKLVLFLPQFTSSEKDITTPGGILV